MVDIIRGQIRKPALTQLLEDYFMKRKELEGILYFGYPSMLQDDKIIHADALYVSEKYGIVLFHLVEEDRVYDLTDLQDDMYNQIQLKLMKNKKLIEKRKLNVNLSIVSYAPSWTRKDISEDMEYSVALNENELDDFLNECIWDNNELYPFLLQTVQEVTSMKKLASRSKVTKVDSKGAKLVKLEKEVAKLDIRQNSTVIETSKNVQRIRGLAGSGKTIILALKAAYLHINNPEWDIVVTFNTRALKDQFIELIDKFVFEQTGGTYKPNWEKIKVIHAWGSPNDEGVYYNVCKLHGAEYHDFNSAQYSTRLSILEPFEFACSALLSQVSNFKKMYDVIIIDEAQDFSKEFLRICHEILPKDEKRLVFAYDELQTLGKQSMESPETIFGLLPDGSPKVELKNVPGLPKEDIILKTCYRNSRPILASAHALGFGTYRKDGLVQLFDEPNLWKEIGYDILDGELKDNSKVRLGRTLLGSPKFLEEHSAIDDIIQFEVFKDALSQAIWVANEIEKNLTQDELEFEDIIVVHTDPLTTRSEVGLLRNILREKGINTHLAGVSTSRDQFFIPNSITFTGIYRAKGNEAAMVYVIDAQNCYSGSELAKKRNILFTAITRSKAWVRITGYGKGAELLKQEEFDTVKSNNFELEFIYPDEEKRKQMKIIHRDKTKQEQQKINNYNSLLENLANDLQKGDIHVEDLANLDLFKGLIKNE